MLAGMMSPTVVSLRSDSVFEFDWKLFVEDDLPENHRKIDPAFSLYLKDTRVDS